MTKVHTISDEMPAKRAAAGGGMSASQSAILRYAVEWNHIMFSPAIAIATNLSRNCVLFAYATAFEMNRRPPVITATTKAIHVYGSSSAISVAALPR